MTDLGLGPFAQGFVFGLALAVPVGAIGLLCIRRSLEHGFATGLATGLGAAVADAGYGAIAAFGLTAVSDFLLAWQSVLALAGGVALIWLGVQAWRTRAKASEHAAPVGPHPLLAFLQTVGLTLANPQTVLTFLALFAGLGLVFGGGGGWVPAALLILGVFSGSAVWWVVLSGTAGLVLRRRLNDRTIVWINRGAGALIVAFGLLALGRGLGLL